ncbi:MAG: hypothetical protein HUK12_06155 [Muribaculaceae bacterium]|nr:hypothetical protein [Muribaculaceae bacterium]
MRKIAFTLLAALLCANCASALSGKIYCSWQAVMENLPDTVLDLKVKQKDYCDFEFKSNDKKVSKRVKQLLKDVMIVELDTAQFFMSGKYLKNQKFDGEWMVKNFAPVYFNDKLAVLQIMRPDRDPANWSWAFLDDNIFVQLLDSGYDVASIVEMAATGVDDAYFYLINYQYKQLQRIDYEVMIYLLNRYPDLLRRYDMMIDNEYPYMIRSYFTDFLTRVQHDPNVESFWHGK